MLGTFVDPTTAPQGERADRQRGHPVRPAALQAGTITAEEFVRLNEGAGGYDDDLNWTGPSPAPGIPAPRQHALASTLHTAYSGGMVSDGRQLAKVAIIDLRGNQSAAGDIHMNWRPFAVRDRLDRQFGDHDNQVIWAYTGGGGAGAVGAALSLKSFTTMDNGSRTSRRTRARSPSRRRSAPNKPAGARDICLANNGATAT